MCCHFLNDLALTHIYTLSLHDALPIFPLAAQDTLSRAERFMRDCDHFGRRDSERFCEVRDVRMAADLAEALAVPAAEMIDRKSERLNSSHSQISYAVFCLKKKKIKNTP